MCSRNVRRVRGKCLVLVLLILAVATFAAATMNAHAHSDPQDYVKVYIWNPATASNIYPALAYPVASFVEVWIDSPAAWYDTSSGIVGVTASLRVNPAVINLVLALKMPDLDGMGEPDSFLGEFLTWAGPPGNEYIWQGYQTSFLGGTKDAVAGTYTGTAEAILGFTTLGVGAGAGPLPMFRWRLMTQSGVDYTTAYSPLTLFDCYYTTVDGVKHPVDIVQSGHYGTPPPQYHMSAVGPFDPTSPIGTAWHELYPTYCNMWDLTSWEDNGDDYLSASDQIDMVNETGWTYWFHVDVVTTTIHWTFKTPDTGTGDAEPAEYTDEPITDPIGTTWHQIYPDYCRWFRITSWEDNANGVFDESDQFDFEYFDEPGHVYWAHLDEVTTDIILSQKGDPEGPTPEFPLGLEIMMMLAAAIPIVYVWRTRKWSGKK